VTETPGPAPAIELQDVTVRYAVPREAIDTLKEYALRRLRGRLEHDELVALRNVDLRIQPGESVGVIGANGAGKSTLFRLLARVRRPNEGHVVVRGRVAALLELGAGFHGELTGRENVILMGTLLGFSRTEMLRRTADIAAFAELEPFLDVPVRNYSSGMAARLGFAVATDVEPDILLVDEALAVGDERFRERCRERMARFRDGRRTFLLVSHALEEVVSSCSRAVWISGGRLVADGPSPEVVEKYRAWCHDAREGAA
jgi:ABC-type polysaccharide/polyol phosphate transport system ATPase subunit